MRQVRKRIGKYAKIQPKHVHLKTVLLPGIMMKRYGFPRRMTIGEMYRSGSRRTQTWSAMGSVTIRVGIHNTFAASLSNQRPCASDAGSRIMSASRRAPPRPARTILVVALVRQSVHVTIYATPTVVADSPVIVARKDTPACCAKFCGGSFSRLQPHKALEASIFGSAQASCMAGGPLDTAGLRALRLVWGYLKLPLQWATGSTGPASSTG